jgi:hypothetical protein
VMSLDIQKNGLPIERPATVWRNCVAATRQQEVPVCSEQTNGVDTVPETKADLKAQETIKTTSITYNIIKICK